MDDGKWRKKAACRTVDPRIFFPTRGEDNVLRAAKEICTACSVNKECLNFALEWFETSGVWGGTSERERRGIRRDRRSQRIHAL